MLCWFDVRSLGFDAWMFGGFGGFCCLVGLWVFVVWMLGFWGCDARMFGGFRGFVLM